VLEGPPLEIDQGRVRHVGQLDRPLVARAVGQRPGPGDGAGEPRFMLVVSLGPVPVPGGGGHADGHGQDLVEVDDRADDANELELAADDHRHRPILADDGQGEDHDDEGDRPERPRAGLTDGHAQHPRPVGRERLEIADEQIGLE